MAQDRNQDILIFVTFMLLGILTVLTEGSVFLSFIYSLFRRSSLRGARHVGA